MRTRSTPSCGSPAEQQGMHAVTSSTRLITDSRKRRKQFARTSTVEEDFRRPSEAAAVSVATAGGERAAPQAVALPPKRIYKNNGYLMVSCNGGLNQMRAAICDMLTIARYLNVTLIVPELDKTSFWADPSDFQDIFDVDYFIASLRDEVRILRRLPPRLKRRVEMGFLHSMAPVSWSDITYYHHQILPRIRKYKVLHLNRTDARLANNGLPLEIQKLRCRVNYAALRFTPEIEKKKLADPAHYLILQITAQCSPMF